MHEMQKLVGKTIKSVRLSEGALLIFETDDGLCGYAVYGDCCSQSYFYEITGVDKILGRKIVAVEDIEMDSVPTDDAYDVIQAYGIRISAEPSVVEFEGNPVETSNSMLVVFRNSSNGYYGGSIEESEAKELAGNVIENNWSLE